MATDPSRPPQPADPLTAVYTASTSNAEVTSPGAGPATPHAAGAPAAPVGSASPPGARPGGTGDPGQAGVGVEGETDIWEARYSLKNYVGRALVLLALTGFWIYVATYNSNEARGRMSYFANFVGWVTLGLWVLLGLRMLQAHYSRYYKLTTRRLIHASGILRARHDQMELLHVKDVFTSQDTILQRILGLGTVVVVSDDADLPTFYYNGVNAPKKVMDLIWHHTRAEREQRSVEVSNT